MESITEEPIEALTFATTTTSAVTANMKSQLSIEEPIDYQAMVVMQVLAKEIIQT